MRTTNDFAQSLLISGDIESYQTLVSAGYDLSADNTEVGTSAKQRWIVILSLMVCVVGIINAQLMSVTERFREIGTMKCLGALDRFIVRLFILEALMQGVSGSLAGAVLGLIAAAFSALFNLGFAAITAAHWPSIILSMSLAAATGTILSLIGVIYPAVIAARMQPIEAMRVRTMSFDISS